MMQKIKNRWPKTGTETQTDGETDTQTVGKKHETQIRRNRPLFDRQTDRYIYTDRKRLTARAKHQSGKQDTDIQRQTEDIHRRGERQSAF